MIVFIAFFVLCSNSIYATEKIICGSNKTAHFGTNEIIFFESQNYPKSMKNECEMNFILENYNNIVNGRLVFVVTNGKMPRMMLTANDVPVRIYGNIATINVTNSTEINAKIYFKDGYNAFQGMIASDDWNIRCPFESITNISPYMFTDETEIFYLFYPYDQFSTADVPRGRCIWKFLTPKKYYKFKFVITTLVEETNVELIYGKSQHTVINSPFDDFVLSPNYLDGPVLEVIFNFPAYNLTAFVYAQFYVTIVKAFPFRGNAGCETTEEGKTVKWEITNGYANNAKCQLNLTLPVKNQYIATITNFSIEDGIDHLRFHYDNKVINVEKDKRGETLQYSLQSNINGYNSFVLWEFISDGSVAQEGFNVIFEEFECNCNIKKTILSCDETTYLQFMDPEYHDPSRGYCGNLHCNYTIDVDPKCPEKIIFIAIYLDDFIDEYILTTNDGQEIASGKSYVAETDIGLFLSPKKFPLKLELISVPNICYRGFQVTFDAVDPPLMFKKITLTKENPMYYFEIDVLPSNSYAMIELDQALIDQKDTMEIFSNLVTHNNLYFYLELFHQQIYLPFDVSIAVGSRYTSRSDFNITSFYVYQYQTSSYLHPGTLLFKAKNAYSSGCIFEGNVFNGYYIADNDEKTSMIAKENETCEVIFLNRLPETDLLDDYGFPIPHAFTYFWTNSKHQNVQIFNSGEFFEVEFNATNPLNAVNLASLFYSIKIPPKSSILIGFSRFKNNLQLSYPFKALWSTPYYGSATTALSVVYTDGFIVPEHIVANIKILSYDVSLDGYFYFEIVGLMKQLVSNVSQTFTFTNATVGTEFNENEKGHIGVLFQIETTLN